MPGHRSGHRLLLLRKGLPSARQLLHSQVPYTFACSTTALAGVQAQIFFPLRSAHRFQRSGQQLPGLSGEVLLMSKAGRLAASVMGRMYIGTVTKAMVLAGTRRYPSAAAKDGGS